MFIGSKLPWLSVTCTWSCGNRFAVNLLDAYLALCSHYLTPRCVWNEKFCQKKKKKQASKEALCLCLSHLFILLKKLFKPVVCLIFNSYCRLQLLNSKKLDTNRLSRKERYLVWCARIQRRVRVISVTCRVCTAGTWGTTRHTVPAVLTAPCSPLAGLRCRRKKPGVSAGPLSGFCVRDLPKLPSAQKSHLRFLPP